MIIPVENFLTYSLNCQPWGPRAARILAASLAAVDPGNALANNLEISQGQLKIGAELLDLDHFQRVHLLAIGKAALPMALRAGEILGSYLESAIILTKAIQTKHTERLPPYLQHYFGGHPIPDQHSLDATQEIIKNLSGLSARDLVLILLSGGGSALLCLPAKDLSLEDLVQTNQVLLRSGAPIQDVNTIRKHLSEVKGGKLARLLRPARTITLILSDVIGDPMDQIASGPTVPDTSTFLDALAIVRKYNLEDSLSIPVLEHLKQGVRGDIEDTLKPGDRVFDQSYYFIIANNRDAARGGLEQAGRENLQASVLPDPITGEASLVGKRLAKELVKQKTQGWQGTCTIGGGETTVTLPPSLSPRKGGRNLELALSAVADLDGVPDVCLVSLATDGEDGFTDAAGAVVTGDSFRRARKLGLDPEDYIKRHDSYNFFKSLDDLIITGSTGTNVNDLCFLFTW